MYRIKDHNKHFYYFLVLLTFLQASLFSNAQSLPPFKLKNTMIRVPAFMPGIMDDPSAVLQNDTLIYNFNSQIFPKGFPVKPGKAYKKPVTPWQTIAELTDAYFKKDKTRIIALYTPGSQQKITEILSGDQSAAFLDYVSKAAGANLKIMGGMDYQNGFLAFTKDDVFGLHENFMTIENKQVNLSALDDKSATGWNIGLYFKYEPGPMIELRNLSFPATLGLDDSATVRVTLQEKGRWIAVFMNTPEGPVPLLVQDNGMNDNDPAPFSISFQLHGRLFSKTGEYSFYAASFNFPVQRISKNFIRGDAPYRIKIK